MAIPVFQRSLSISRRNLNCSVNHSQLPWQSKSCQSDIKNSFKEKSHFAIKRTFCWIYFRAKWVLQAAPTLKHCLFISCHISVSGANSFLDKSAFFQFISLSFHSMEVCPLKSMIGIYVMEIIFSISPSISTGFGPLWHKHIEVPNRICWPHFLLRHAIKPKECFHFTRFRLNFSQ